MDEDPVDISLAFSGAMLLLRREFLSDKGRGAEGEAERAADLAVRAAALAEPLRSFAASGGIEGLPDGDSRAAFWINAFNGLVSLSLVELRATLELPRYPAYRVRTVLAAGGLGLSLDDIEHGILRGNKPPPDWPFRPFGPGDGRRRLALEAPDPRIRFALNCGSASCPPVRLCRSAGLGDQLALAEAEFASDHFRPDPAERRIACSRLFAAFKRDFPGRWLDDPAYRAWRVSLDPFDLSPGPG